MASTNVDVLWFALIIFIVQHAIQTVSRPIDTTTTTLPFILPVHDMKLFHEQWMIQYGRVYENAVENEKRYVIFKENVERISKFNDCKSNKSYTLRINEFGDLTPEEVQATRKGSRTRFDTINEATMKKSNVSGFDNFGGNLNNIAPSVDWRTRGAITPIKNQGVCGSCWAFATVAAIESINQIITGNLISLSEQDLLDCLDSSGNSGCNGGVMGDAFSFMAQGNRLPTESEYPYQGGQRQCRMPLGGEQSGVTIRNFRYLLQPNDFTALKQALNNQPVAISIDSRSYDFTYYGGGIFDQQLNMADIDHDLLLIGYGTSEDGVNYWLLKNSWGTNWGEDGFMRLLMDENRCPIASNAFAPEM